MTSQRAQGLGWWQSLKPLPLVMALGIGLAVNNARAVVEALMGYETGFVRTPKHGVQVRGESVARKNYRAAATLQPLVELALAGYMTYGVVYLWQRGIYSSIPFLVLFQIGFGYVAVVSIYEGLRGRRRPVGQDAGACDRHHPGVAAWGTGTMASAADLSRLGRGSGSFTGIAAARRP